MAISLVQSFAGATSGHTLNNVDVTLPGATTTGNCIIIAVSSYGSTQTCTGITDNASNTFVKIGSTIRSPGDDTLDLFYAKNITGNAAPDFLIQMANIENIGGVVLEYSGLDTTAPFDQTNTGTGTSATNTTGSITPSGNGYLIVAAGTDQIADTATVTAGSGYTLRGMAGTSNNSVRVYAEDQIQTTAASISASFTMTASSFWASKIASFKPAGGGPAPSALPLGTLMMMGCGV